MKNKQVVIALLVLILVWMLFFRKKSGYESRETDELLAANECARYNS